ncbi:PD40 domain-containing protein [Xanthovirga aplysinae]|uniref:PD40 domain-containing protein n=1 Tax=Xanthovirga aplysinae TaxID=2529853 RepID=UPI0012BC27B9|nr:PD40 domain-containing protein [Xanthovirga aplysinae]MTI32104.1 hypothetical protein [Xanthovirga aplysinae]
MRKILIILLTILQNAYLAYSQKAADIFKDAELVGEGVISSKDFEFNFTLTEEGDLAFFSKAVLPDWRHMSIVYAEKKNGKWSEPQLAPYSGRYRDADPFIAPDQSKLIYISNRPSKYQKKPSDFSLWYVLPPFEKTKEPRLLEGDFYEVGIPTYPSFSLNGNLYFSSKGHIYFVKNEDGKYGKARKLFANRSKPTDGNPVVAPDESFIIFTSRSREGGYGQADLFVSFNNNGKWSEAVNLGPKINSYGRDSDPGLSTDGKTLYFTSMRMVGQWDFSPRSRQVTNEEFEKELAEGLNNLNNGLPNIWAINIENIQALNPGF